MIIDAHCHAWRCWPYPTAEPEHGLSTVEQLLDQQADVGVDHALVVAARIGAERPTTDNRDNNDYVAAAVRTHPERLSICADVDSFWSPEHHSHGAATRLERIADRTGAVAFTHYSTGRYDGWFDQPDGLAMFERAAELGLIASLHTPPDWAEPIGRLARRLPQLPILVHHQGHVRTRSEPNAELAALLANAELENIYLKVSGFYYLTNAPFPYRDAVAQLQQIFRAYGPGRMVWGSDWPVAAQFLSYRQTLDLLTQHCPFIPPDALPMILGDNLAALLADARTVIG